MTSRALRLLAALLLSAAVLAGCGGDDGDDAASTSTTDAAEDEAADETTTTSSPSTTEAADPEATTTTASGGGASGVPDPAELADVDFCGLDRVGDESDAFFILFDPATTPDARAEAADYVEALYARIGQAAPPEIAADVALVLEGAAAFLEALEGHGWDIVALQAAAESDPELAAVYAFDDPATVAAGDNIDAWIDANCPDVD